MYKFQRNDQIRREDYLDLENQIESSKIQQEYASWEVKEFCVTQKGEKAEYSEDTLFTHIITSPSKRLWTLKECSERISNGINLEDKLQKEAGDAFGLFNLLYNIRNDRYFLPEPLKHLEP